MIKSSYLKALHPFDDWAARSKLSSGDFTAAGGENDFWIVR
jgi:hypothetical protein